MLLFTKRSLIQIMDSRRKCYTFGRNHFALATTIFGISVAKLLQLNTFGRNNSALLLIPPVECFCSCLIFFARRLHYTCLPVPIYHLKTLACERHEHEERTYLLQVNYSVIATGSVQLFLIITTYSRNMHGVSCALHVPALSLLECCLCVDLDLVQDLYVVTGLAPEIDVRSILAVNMNPTASSAHSKNIAYVSCILQSRPA